MNIPLDIRFVFCPISLAGLLVLCLDPTYSEAQEKHETLAPHVLTVDSVLNGTNTEIVSTTVALYNHTEEPSRGWLKITSPPELKLLGTATPTVHLAAKSKQFLPLKVHVSASARAGTYPISLQWIDSTGRRLQQADTRLTILPKRAVWLQATKPTELIRHAGDSLLVRVAVRNAGNTHERIKLVASIPDPQRGRLFTSRDVDLQAAVDTTVVFGYVVDRSMMELGHFTVNVTGLYANNELFGNTAVNVQNAAANRRYMDPTTASVNRGYQPRNSVSLQVRNALSDQQWWQLNGRGSYALGNGSLDFNTDAYQWGGLDGRPVLYNTWIRYGSKQIDVTAGNISESLETFVNGRGVKVHFNDSLHNRSFEGGLVNHSFDLLGNSGSAGYADGFTAYLKTTGSIGQPEKRNYTGTAIYERKPIENRENFLYMHTVDLVKSSSDSLRLVADIAPAATRQLDTSAAGGATFFPAMAAGLQLQFIHPSYSLTSNNFYSTGYYPGVRRGVLQLNQRISRSIKRTNLWMQYSLNEYAPKYLENQSEYRSYFLVSRAEAGMLFPLTTSLSLSFVPLHEYERGSYTFGATADDDEMRLNSYRLNTTINWRSSDYKQQGYLLLESGLGQFRPSLAGGSGTQLRASLSYSYAWFNANINAQRGNMSLMEAANNLYFGREHPYRIGASASAQRYFLRKKAQAEISLSYYKDSFSGENRTASGRLRYAFTKKAAFLFTGQYYQYNTPYAGRIANVNVQLGIQMALPDSRGPNRPKEGNIELTVYYDHNHNGIYDEGDSPAGNIMLLVGQTAFVTASDGTVKYSHVPHCTYKISVPAQGGWHADESVLQLNSKQLKYAVPLQHSGTVNGRVQYQYNERLSREIDKTLAGLTIEATNERGQVTETVTDAEGNYVLFLPPGDYEIRVAERSLPRYVIVETPVQQLRVVASKLNPGPLFALKAEEKKIEVKRFSSLN